MTNNQPGNNPQGPQYQEQPQLPWWRYVVWLVVLVIFSWYWMGPAEDGRQILSYSEFKAKVVAEQISWVEFQGDRVSGEFRNIGMPASTGDSKLSARFITTLPPLQDPGLISLLEQHEVEIRAVSGEAHWLAKALVGVVPWILIIGLFWYVSNRMQKRLGGAGGLFDFGKSKAKRFRRTDSKLSFDNVAGLENAKQDLNEIVGYLKNPEHYRKLGAKIPRGILLMGPPGTGKTLLAKAVAGEADVPFFSISGSEFIEMFVGVGASRVRDMFESARKESPSIISAARAVPVSVAGMMNASRR